MTGDGGKVMTQPSGRPKSASLVLDSARLCAQFLGMPYAGELWGKGGPPDAVRADAAAIAQAEAFFRIAR